MDKLDKIAEALGDKVVFAALCLDDPDFAQELVDEHDWDHITHGGMDLETKEKAKAAFGFNVCRTLSSSGRRRRLGSAAAR